MGCILLKRKALRRTRTCNLGLRRATRYHCASRAEEAIINNCFEWENYIPTISRLQSPVIRSKLDEFSCPHLRFVMMRIGQQPAANSGVVSFRPPPDAHLHCGPPLNTTFTISEHRKGISSLIIFDRTL